MNINLNLIRRVQREKKGGTIGGVPPILNERRFLRFNEMCLRLADENIISRKQISYTVD